MDKNRRDAGAPSTTDHATGTAAFVGLARRQQGLVTVTHRNASRAASTVVCLAFPVAYVLSDGWSIVDRTAVGIAATIVVGLVIGVVSTLLEPRLDDNHRASLRGGSADRGTGGTGRT